MSPPEALGRLKILASEEAERESRSEEAQRQRPARQRASRISPIANAAECVGAAYHSNRSKKKRGEDTELAQVESVLPVDR